MRWRSDGRLSETGREPKASGSHSHPMGFQRQVRALGARASRPNIRAVAQVSNRKNRPRLSRLGRWRSWGERRAAVFSRRGMGAMGFYRCL